ncbi:MAG: GAF domain-containing protein [Anaerolineae bacterium]|nr:GAF domain-containing protein [Anaerolineae bacterium]
MATILHIDRDEATQTFIQSALGEQYNIITAADGPTAIQYCAIIQPDLVLMDLTLPDIDGYELVSRLKAFMPHTPILILTQNYFDEDTAQALGGSVNGFLKKPIDISALQQRLQSCLPPLAKLSQGIPPLSPDDKIVQHFEAQIAVLNQANKRLASINAVSALIGVSLDLQHLTDEILVQIHKTIDFDSATLFLLKGDILDAVASRGLAEYRQGMNTYRRSSRNSAWRVVDNKLPLIINDVTQSEVWESRPELGQVRAWLGVPLIYKDRVVGVLTLDKNEPHAFSDADARYVFNLAYQIAIAVENAQLFEGWEKQSTRLKFINEVAQEINTILDVDTLFDALARAIYEKLAYDGVAIFELDPPREFLVLKAIYGQASQELKPGVYRQDVNRGLIGKVARTGRTLLVNDTSVEESFLPIANLQVGSELVVPIFIDNQVGAVINVDRSYPNGFDDHDLWTLSSLASQAATAIENARLYRQVQAYSDKLERTVVARTQRLQAIKKISQVVSQGLVLDELLAMVGQGIAQIFASDTFDTIQVAIGLLDGPDVLLKSIYSDAEVTDRPVTSDFNQAAKADHVLRLKIHPSTPIGQVIEQARPVILNNFNMQSGQSRVTQEIASANSVMLAPLITGGKMIGLIKVEGNAPNIFGENDLETLEALAFQVASAIEHARLLQRTREIAIVEERTRLARDMHDGVAQNLAYLLLQVDRCLNIVEEGGKLEAHLERIYTLLKQNIDELRRNIFDLRPVDLEGKSLFEVLENFVAEFGCRWHLKTSCVVTGEPVEVSPEVESALYRILQESLSNAQQHAQCKQLAVSLAGANDNWIILEVRDDGRGFDLQQIEQVLPAQTGKGLGLVSMRERAHTVGGRLTIESRPGQGTRVFAKLPARRGSKKYPNPKNLETVEQAAG